MTKQHHSKTQAHIVALGLLTFLVTLAVGNAIGAALVPVMFL